MNERIEGLAARKGVEWPVAGTAFADFPAFPPQEASHDPVQASIAAVTRANGGDAREIVGAIFDPFE
jgi:hypothetical protein